MISGHKMATRCIAAGPGVTLAANTIDGKPVPTTIPLHAEVYLILMSIEFRNVTPRL